MACDQLAVVTEACAYEAVAYLHAVIDVTDVVLCVEVIADVAVEREEVCCLGFAMEADTGSSQESGMLIGVLLG